MEADTIRIFEGHLDRYINRKNIEEYRPNASKWDYYRLAEDKVGCKGIFLCLGSEICSVSANTIDICTWGLVADLFVYPFHFHTYLFTMFTIYMMGCTDPITCCTSSERMNAEL